MLLRLLLALESSPLRKRLRRLLKDDLIFELPGAAPDVLLRELSRESCDLVIVDKSVFDTGGQDWMASLRSLPEPPEVVVISKQEDAQERARLLAKGCLAMLQSDVPVKMFNEALSTVLNRRRESIDRTIAYAPRSARSPRLADFVSTSPSMQAFINVVKRVASSDSTLLITGETGVGKERLARAIHGEGPRAGGSFVAVNCGALPETLLESELFGHEEGAFTGASRARRGWFELAHGGTIFLDEIAEMPLHLQVKLLHVLQNHEVQRLGSERSIEVDVRVIAATNRDLLADVEEGRFRRDLYYRLGVINLSIPPLRERREDIPALVDDYINHFRTTIGRDVHAIDPVSLQCLVEYAWPGNVRELINVIERAVLLCETDTITSAELPDNIAPSTVLGGRAEVVSAPSTRNDSLTFPARWLEQPIRQARREVVDTFERAYLDNLLKKTRGRVGETARLAGIEQRSLYEKMKRHRLRKEDYRRS